MVNSIKYQLKLIHWNCTDKSTRVSYPRWMKPWRVVTCIFLLFLRLPSAEAGTLAQFRTVFGDIEVELYDQDKPVTV